MDKLISELNTLVTISNTFLLKDLIADEEFYQYKNNCETHFAYLILKNYNYTITELAKLGLAFKVKRINHPFLQWIYKCLTSKNSVSFNAPYLNGFTELDYKKKYIFWTKMRIEGIILNLERL